MSRIALLASLDTKLSETMYAKEETERCGCRVFLIDTSTGSADFRGADIGPKELLSYIGMSWEEFSPLGKAACIDAMSRALSVAVPALYRDGRFDGIVSVGGGQNAYMAAAAMKPLPFGVPKIIASSLACGKRQLGQYVGDNDIMVLHTVADISMLNDTTRTVIANACHAACGMLEHRAAAPQVSFRKVAATMLGITAKGVEGVLHRLPDDQYEKTCFHANGVGGRCMEKLIRAGKFDLILDMTLHEITCEVFGGYCSGAVGRLSAAIETGTPMIVVPGAIDMLDFYTGEGSAKLPAHVSRRKKVMHNASIMHTKVFPDEAEKLALVLAERLNRAVSPVTLLLPDGGFCEASAPGGAMYDPEADARFIATVKSHISPSVRIMDVKGNLNDAACQDAVFAEILRMEKGVKA